MLELLLNAAKDKEELWLMKIRYVDILLLLPDKYEECEEHLYKALWSDKRFKGTSQVVSVMCFFLPTSLPTGEL